MRKELDEKPGELPSTEGVQLPVKLPNIESGGPFRKIVGPVAIVERKYLEWLERGSEMNINDRVIKLEDDTPLRGPVGFQPLQERTT